MGGSPSAAGRPRGLRVASTQNTPADGPYPFIQPGVDYRNGDAYCETAMIPRGNDFPDAGRNRKR